MKLDEIVPASERKASEPSAHDNTRAVLGQVFKAAVSGAVNVLTSGSGTGQERQERSAERAKEEIGRQLLKLELAPKLHEQLLPLLEPAGCRLERELAEHPYGTLTYAYTALRGNGLDVALLQPPPEAFATDDGGSALYLSDFANMLKAFRKRRMRLFAQDIEGLPFGCEEALADEGRDGDFRFVNWNHIQGLLKTRIKFWQALRVDRPDKPAAERPQMPKALDDKQIGAIVKVLVARAKNAIDRSDTFPTLVAGANWPEAWKEQRLSGWTNDFAADARTFISFMQSKNVFPANHELAGQSVVGDFLRRLLQEGGLGGDEADVLAHIVVECSLVPDAASYTSYYL